MAPPAMFLMSSMVHGSENDTFPATLPRQPTRRLPLRGYARADSTMRAGLSAPWCFHPSHEH
jgi:hypothetical protein